MDTTELVEDILSHHGVKGMKWGVRQRIRESTGRAGPQKVTVKPTVTRKGIKTKGGAGHPAHPDAVRARTLGQVGKKSGLSALSDNELQAYTKRLNLEANANRLNYGEKSSAVKFVKRVLGQSGEQAITTETNKASTRLVKKHVATRMAKIGAAAAA